MSYYDFWVAREASGTLRIFESEPVYAEGFWFAPGAQDRYPTTWVRKMPPRWFPEVKPGEKLRCRLSVEPSSEATSPL